MVDAPFDRTADPGGKWHDKCPRILDRRSEDLRMRPQKDADDQQQQPEQPEIAPWRQPRGDREVGHERASLPIKVSMTDCSAKVPMTAPLSSTTEKGWPALIMP